MFEKKKKKAFEHSEAHGFQTMNNLLNPTGGLLYIVINAWLMIDAATKTSACDADQCESPFFQQNQRSTTVACEEIKKYHERSV